MNSKTIAAAFTGLCLTWGAAHAAPEPVQEPQAASPVEVPEAVGATNDVVILELGPTQGGVPGNAEEMAAMQMLLLQLLMMQSQMGADGGEMPMIVPSAPGGTGI
jgi:hypothetical protein